MAGDERESGGWIGELLEAEARGYEPDGERLRELVAVRIARDEETGAPAARRRARRGSGGALRALWTRTASTGAALAAVAAAVALAVAVATTLAVTSSTPATGGRNTATGGTGGATSGGTHGTSVVLPLPDPDPAADSGHPAASASSASSGPGGATDTRGTAGAGSTPDAYTVSATIDSSSTANAVWTQLDVSIVATRPVETPIEITIDVAACAGFNQAASYSTAPATAVGKSISAGPDGSTEFVFHLAAGQNPGTMEFAAQFGHAATGCDPAADTYRVSGPDGAVTASGGY